MALALIVCCCTSILTSISTPGLFMAKNILKVNPDDNTTTPLKVTDSYVVMHSLITAICLTLVVIGGVMVVPIIESAGKND
jgi:hypothetical protein